ncbi:hypothetical protein Hdeb2414_s1255g00999681 [Helianthus debilis subsp. tardiflorus]
MERKLIACGTQFPPLSANYPWLVAQNPDGSRYQTFYRIPDQLYHYNCRIPELLGRLIRGHSHGWVILSKKNMWSLWNPATSKIINLPPLSLNDSESVGQCCLSSPPDDPTSVLLLTITGERTFVFCQLGYKLDRLIWTRRPYNRQLTRINGHYDGILQCPTSYNGKVYALCNKGESIIQVDIIVNDSQPAVELSRVGKCPSHTVTTHFPISIPLLKGSNTELFYIRVAFKEVTSLCGVTRKTLGNVCLFKRNTASMMWEEMVNLKGAVFFVDLSSDCSIYYSRVFASELEGYIHIRDEIGNMMYSYDMEDKTISVSSIAYSPSHVSLWECRLKVDDEDSELTCDLEKEEDKNGTIDVRSPTYEEVELHETRLLNLPFHLLEMITDRCIGVEYMYFRATCKSCRLAAPLIRWSDKTTSRRLHNYSLMSPWLMVVDKNKDKGTINLIDPVFGDKYYMKRSRVFIYRDKILCSRFGWLLFYSGSYTLSFFNPFTSEIRKLPYTHLHFDSLCFSAPPTSPDCMVVGFYTRSTDVRVCVHFVAREQTWHTIQLDFGGAPLRDFRFPTFCGRDLYVLCDKGQVCVLKNLRNFQRCNFKKVGPERVCEGDCFLVKRDQQFLLVVVGEYIVEVFKLNDHTKDWEKVYCLGRYTIYIGDTTCLCVEAKAPEMENAIFFPRLHSRDGNVVFYSLETCRYRMLNGKNVEEIVGVGREHTYPHAWIEPSWS